MNDYGKNRINALLERELKNGGRVSVLKTGEQGTVIGKGNMAGMSQ